VLEESTNGVRSITTAGNANRNPNAFDDKFQRFAGKLRAAMKEETL